MHIWRCDTDVWDIERSHAPVDGSTVHRDMCVEEGVNVSGAHRRSELTSSPESQIAARYQPGTDIISELGWPVRQVVGDYDNAGEYLEIPVTQDGSDGPLVVPVVNHDSSNSACGSHFSVSLLVSGWCCPVADGRPPRRPS
jgi:hypothetical protein